MWRTVLSVVTAACLFGLLQAQSEHSPRHHVACRTAPLLPKDTVTIARLTVHQSMRVDVSDDRACLGVIYLSNEVIGRYVVFYPPCTPDAAWVQDHIRYKDVQGATNAVVASHCP